MSVYSCGIYSRKVLVKELSLKEIQKHSLDVLLHFHDFCMKHGISYTLAYGTLIGAVRHKGFIPWDDDIDVIMTREYFEKFLREYQPSDGFLLVSPNDKKSYLAFARVCDLKNTMIVSRFPWSKYTTGVWIDIFPMDSIADEENRHKERFKKINKEWSNLVFIRGAKAHFSSRWSIKQNLRMLEKKLKTCNGFGLRKRVESFIKEIQDKAYSGSSHCAQLACCDEYGFYDKKDFEEYITLEFEGHQLMAIKEYDKVLRLLYGDYMQLPPKINRVPKQSDDIRFFRRD